MFLRQITITVKNILRIVKCLKYILRTFIKLCSYILNYYFNIFCSSLHVGRLLGSAVSIFFNTFRSFLEPLTL